MPKRAYPFKGDLLPQMKVHVGEKQVNNGVSANQRMQHVYGKYQIHFVKLFVYSFLNHTSNYSYISR